jgi:methylmalonyl-CoA/ethylmalonyl-CoA epimerase
MLDFKIDHLGYAVSDIDRSLKVFLDLGYKKVSDLVIDEIRNVKIVFVKKSDLKIELISPLNEKSPINSYLKKNGNTPYHICYHVQDIFETIEKLKAMNFKLIERPNAAIALKNKKVAFLFNIDYGILELVEQ